MQLSQLEEELDPVFGQLSFDDHEQIVFCNDTGLKAIIGIHNSWGQL
jgi:leucine dehydrogenase